MLDYENMQNPFFDRKVTIAKWKLISVIDLNETQDIIQSAERISSIGVKSKDALHIACALVSKCDYFITTDYKILNKNSAIENIYIVSPQEIVKFIDGESIDEN